MNIRMVGNRDGKVIRKSVYFASLPPIGSRINIMLEDNKSVATFQVAQYQYNIYDYCGTTLPFDVTMECINCGVGEVAADGIFGQFLEKETV